MNVSHAKQSSTLHSQLQFGQICIFFKSAYKSHKKNIQFTSRSMVQILADAIETASYNQDAGFQEKSQLKAVKTPPANVVTTKDC